MKVQDMIDESRKDKTGFIMVVDGSRNSEVTIRFKVDNSSLAAAIISMVKALEAERPGIQKQVKESL